VIVVFYSRDPATHAEHRMTQPESCEPRRLPKYGEAFIVWCRVALLSFGGPAGQIAVMHRILVDEKKWVSESRFLHALNYCMLLPGPEAQQLATYIGWLLHRTLGGLTAGVLFVLPGFVSILALSFIYVTYHDLTLVAGMFYGLKPAVIAIVVEAIFRIGRRALKNNTMRLVAVAAFLAIYLLQVPFPALVLAAGIIGFLGGKIAPEQFVVIKGHSEADVSDHEDIDYRRPTSARTLRVALTWLLLWFTPVVICYAALGPENVFTQEALLFSKAAMVTFGGAYSVLAYVAEQCVESYHWLEPAQMLDGLGMAETTPGPLIQVVQFVGFMGAYNNAGSLHPLWAAFFGSVLVCWVTYTPCFLWIFLGAPYIEHFRGKQSLNAALSTITAAVVGVILNLSIWFAVHVLFREVTDYVWGPFGFEVPTWSTVDWRSLLLTVIAVAMLFYAKAGVLRTLGVSVALGIVMVLWGS
jgi:chromate transporter